MNDLVIKVSKRSRLIDLDHSTLGIVGENLQEKLVFTFQDEFVDGMARLEYELDGEKHYVLMEKVGQSYILPVQNVLLTKEGNIDLQLVITEDKTGTPVFKSEVFTLYCKKSIEAVGEAPSSYELWIEKANRILLEASRVNIDGKKTGNETIITITQRDGNKKSFPILDGQDGQQGPVGPQGPIGPEGPEGPQGPVGPSPDLSNYVQKTEFNDSQAEQDDTTRELQAELERYKLLENALPHTENETESDYVTLNNTAKAPMEIETIPQTSQDGEPTPDNPQEIHCTTGENTVRVTNSDSSEEKKYGLDLLKNLFNFDGVSNNTIATFANGIATLNWTTGFDCFLLNNGSQYLNDLDSGKKYTISFEHKGDKIRLKDYLSSESITTETDNDFKRYSFDITGISSLRLDIVRADTSGTAQIKNVKVYTERIKMYNINNVSDGFVYDEAEDKFYINRKIGKVLLNGSESNLTELGNYCFKLSNFQNGYDSSQDVINQIYSNYFISQKQIEVYNGSKIGIGILGDTVNALYISKPENIKTVAQFKEWLSAHNTTVVYQLANATLEEITDTTLISQLRAIKNALSMQGTTHIISTASGSNLPFLIKARAVQTIERI